MHRTLQAMQRAMPKDGFGNTLKDDRPLTVELLQELRAPMVGTTFVICLGYMAAMDLGDDALTNYFDPIHNAGKRREGELGMLMGMPVFSDMYQHPDSVERFLPHDLVVVASLDEEGEVLVFTAAKVPSTNQ